MAQGIHVEEKDPGGVETKGPANKLDNNAPQINKELGDPLIGLVAVSSPFKENHNQDMGRSRDTDRNKTPQQKPRRRKHRPKVVKEDKPQVEVRWIPATPVKHVLVKPVPIYTPGEGSHVDHPVNGAAACAEFTTGLSRTHWLLKLTQRRVWDMHGTWIKVFAHDHDAQEIYITENDDVRVDDKESDYWETFWVSNDIAVKHGWRNSHILKAYSLGLGKLTASLSYPSEPDDKKEMIKVVQEVMVCGQVNFTLGNDSGIILLPRFPGVYQELKLKIIGGCAEARLLLDHICK